MASSSRLSSSGLHTNHKLEGMQSDSKTESNGECHTNGYSETNGGSESWRDSFSEKRKRRVQSMTTMETDMISLIGQHLRENGYHKTLESLVEESGCVLEHPTAALFRRHITLGQWDKAISSLEELSHLLTDPSSVEKMRLLILEEKYLELLENGDKLSALHCLRHDLTLLPRYHPDKKIQDLSQYIMCQRREDLLRTANWPGVKGGARERLMDQLQAFLPASIMLPPKRLHFLLRQSVQLQVDKCPFHYHNKDISCYSLLNDHICSRNHFPSETVHTLREHSDEVWFLQFSHDGNRLASGCKDGHIVIWTIQPSERPKKQHVIKAQSSGITCLRWSPDDSLLLSCGAEDCPEVIAYDTQTWEEKFRVNNSPEDSLTCCSWHHSGQKFFVGGLRGQFYECSSENGAVLNSWEGVRLHAIATHPCNDLVYAADSHMRIKQYNFHDKISVTLVKEEHPIMTFSLSNDARYTLLNVASQGVHMWDLIDRCLVKRFQGVTQGFYTIHSCFGINDSFIASGSEDHHVYVWNQRRETPVIVLQGHTRTVNCVSWNPVHPTMIASASDDCTVILWGTEEEMKYQQELEQTELAKRKDEEQSQVFHNGVLEDKHETDEDEDEEFEDDEEEEENEEEEGMDIQSSRPILEADLQALEMLDPESSSRDESIGSAEQLEAAVSLSALSVGLAAVREHSQQLASEPRSEPPASILVIMPAPNSSNLVSSGLDVIERDEEDQEEAVTSISVLTEVPESLISQSSFDQPESESRSLDLDSSMESESSRQMDSLLSEGDILSTSMSVITSVSRTVRTSERSNIGESSEATGQRDVPVIPPLEEVSNGASSSNGSNQESQDGGPHIVESSSSQRSSSNGRTTGILHQ